jgi:hypothetical protein
VFVFFGSFGVLCYDLDGHKLWEHALGPFRDEYGAASSPMLVDDKVILLEDHDIDSFIIALDARTGKMLWKTPRPNAVRSYSTPAIWSSEGRKQLLVAVRSNSPVTIQRTAKNFGGSMDSPALSSLRPCPLATRSLLRPGLQRRQRREDQPRPLENRFGKMGQERDGKLAKAEIDDRNVLERYNRMDLDSDALLNQPEWSATRESFSAPKTPLWRSSRPAAATSPKRPWFGNIAAARHMSRRQLFATACFGWSRTAAS